MKYRVFRDSNLLATFAELSNARSYVRRIEDDNANSEITIEDNQGVQKYSSLATGLPSDFDFARECC